MKKVYELNVSNKEVTTDLELRDEFKKFLDAAIIMYQTISIEELGRHLSDDIVNYAATGLIELSAIAKEAREELRNNNTRSLAKYNEYIINNFDTVYEGFKEYLNQTDKKINSEETCEMENIKALEVIVKEDGMPILPLRLKNVEKELPEDKDYKTFYLSPFRGYKFQISATKDGSWDIASSEVVGLGNMMKLKQEVNADPNVLKSSLFMSNLGSQIIKYQYGLLINDALMNLGYRYNLSCNDLMSPDMEEAISDYIDKVIEYIENLIQA